MQRSCEHRHEGSTGRLRRPFAGEVTTGTKAGDLLTVTEKRRAAVRAGYCSTILLAPAPPYFRTSLPGLVATSKIVAPGKSPPHPQEIKMKPHNLIWLVAVTLSIPSLHGADLPSGEHPKLSKADAIAFLYVSQAAASPNVQAELKLTDDQFDTMAQIRAKLAQRGRDPAGRRKALEEATKAIQGALSAEQAQRLRQIHLQSLVINAFLVPDVIAALKLSDQQQEQLRAIGVEYAEKRESLRNDKIPRDEGWARMRELNEKTMAEAKAVLTEPQRQQFEKMWGTPFDFSRRVEPSPAYNGKADYLNAKPRSPK